MSVRRRDKKDSMKSSVRSQYENWPFPGTDIRSREWLLLLRRIDKIINEGGEPDSRFIDVGCGTGHTILALARIFKKTQFWGIDFSNNSIERARGLVSKYHTNNVTFKKIDIMSGRLRELGKFRIVYCAGVLHHIKNTDRAFTQIANLVEPDGYLIFWLYGKHGRARHRLNQQFLKRLEPGLSPAKSVDLVREFARQFKDRITSDGGFYTPEGSGSAGLQWMLKHPHWLIDQMLPGYENTFDLGDIFKLLDNNGMVFHNWLGISDSIVSYTSSKLIQERFSMLKGRERLLTIECLIKPEYYFIVARKA